LPPPDNLETTVTPRKELSDTDEKLLAIEDAVARGQARGEHRTPTTFEQPTPMEMAEAKRALDWKRCKEPGGPIYELRQELKAQQEQREKAMKKTISIAVAVVTLATGGIQLWGKMTAHASVNAELVQAIRDLKAEVRTANAQVTKP
jgi:hypothetical protein